MIVNARFLTQRLTGVQRHAVEISLALHEIDPAIKFVAPKNIIHQEIADKLSAELFGHFKGYFWEQYELPKYMQKYAPNDILINLANSAPISYKNKVATIHDTAPLRHPEWYSRKFAIAYKMLLPHVAGSSRVVFSDSDFSRNEISDLFGTDKDKIRVIYCGVGRQFQPTASEASSENYILSVASLEPRKNFAGLIRAFSLLNKHDTKLIIVGSPSRIFAKSELDKILPDSHRVEFAGYVDDIKLMELYRGARLFVFPSLYEGFGLPPLEAMACGCPCAVSKAGSLPEVCGEAALYFNPHDPADIAVKIDMILSDSELRENLIEKGLKQARKYDWKKSALELYTAVKSLQESTN